MSADHCSLGVRVKAMPIQSLAFTLVELLIAIAILVVLIGIAIPAYNDMTLGSKLRSQANDLAAGIVLARSEAIKRNQTVSLCASDDEATCSGSWVDGWVVLASGGALIKSHGAASNGFLIKSDESAFVFSPSGVGVTPVPDTPTFVICRATPTVGGQEREVTLTLTGRATIAATSNAACEP
jgi:type IV fimbrial biogenesis protein FimT